MTDQLAPGAVLSETYRIVRSIGRGGMGSVWIAEHLRLPKQVAIKILHAAVHVNDEARARFRREAEIASRLAHANIVEVLDFNTLPDGVPYLVMELLQGESLRDRLNRGPVSLPDTTSTVRQIASALQVAHRHGVVHRDLKPENVFLCPAEHDGRPVTRVKVLDFGISKLQGASTVLTQEDSVLGTPQYMAPEQVSGGKSVDERTDQFALAAITYEMLTGKGAFFGHNLAEVVYKVVYETPSVANTGLGIPDQVAAAIDRAMAKDPAQRFPDLASFIQAFSGRVLTSANAAAQLVIERKATAADAETLGPAEANISMADTMATPAAIGHAATLATDPSEGPLPSAANIPATVVRTSTPVTLPPAKTTGAGNRAIVALVALAAVLVVAGVVVWATRAPGPAQTGAEVPAQAPVGPDARIAAAHAPTAPPDAAPDQSPRASAAPLDAAVTVVDQRTVAKTARQRTPRRKRLVAETAVPAAVATILEEADKALAERKFRDAVSIARRSLIRKPTVRAYKIMFRAYCAQKDLANARAMLRRVPRRARRLMVRVCRRLGLDL